MGSGLASLIGNILSIGLSGLLSRPGSSRSSCGFSAVSALPASSLPGGVGGSGGGKATLEEKTKKAPGVKPSAEKYRTQKEGEPGRSPTPPDGYALARCEVLRDLALHHRVITFDSDGRHFGCRVCHEHELD